MSQNRTTLRKPNQRSLLTIALLSSTMLVSACTTTISNSVDPVSVSEDVQTVEGTFEYSLNGDWSFRADPNNRGLLEKWDDGEVDTSGWDSLPVPGVWDVVNEYSEYAGAGWYSRTLDVPSNWTGKRVRLVFESVYDRSEVWVNGVKVASNTIGYLPFHADIQDALQPGKTNRITVRTDNTERVGAIWSWGGIRRPVWLEITDPVRIENLLIAAEPNLDTGTATLDVRYTVSNSGDTQVQSDAKLVISRDGEMVWEGSVGEQVQTGPAGEQQQRLSINLPAEDVALWHFNDPNLYQAKLVLLEDGNIVHSLKERFGIRKFELDGLEAKLNGETVRTIGFNTVAEDRVNGNTLPLHRIKEDVDMMKKLGANMARVSHLPLPEAYLDYLDEQGIMTVEEVSLWGEDFRVDPEHPIPKEWLERMIEHKYNHPSIIGWSVGNEIGRPVENPKIHAYIEGAVAMGEALDPSRFVTYVTHSTDENPDDPAQFVDFILMNEYSRWGEKVATTHEYFPTKPIFYSEWGSHLYGEDPNTASGDFSGMLNEMRGRPYLMGASHWTFNDYRSVWANADLSKETAASQNRAWGAVTVDRLPKDGIWNTFQTEHAPVKSMTLAAIDTGIEVSLKPRGKLDLPAYKMDGYVLAWRTLDGDGLALSAGSKNLPIIEPGDEGLTQNLSFASTDATRAIVDLLDPLGNPVLTRTVDYQAPKAPRILKVHTHLADNEGTNTARVVFDRAPNADKYIVRYGTEGLTETSASSVNGFVDIENLPYGQDFEFAVVAINAAGESLPSASETIRTASTIAPPFVWKVTPADRSFAISYTTHKTDYLYEVEYGRAPGTYDHKINMRVPGVGKVRYLENDETYYFRLRRRYQSGYASTWTREFEVTPTDGSSQLDAPSNAVVSINGDQPVLFYDPVLLSTGYQLLITKADGDEKSIDVNTAYSGRYLLPGLSGVDLAKVTIRTRNDAGLLGDPKDVRVIEN